VFLNLKLKSILALVFQSQEVQFFAIKQKLSDRVFMKKNWLSCHNIKGFQSMQCAAMSAALSCIIVEWMHNGLCFSKGGWEEEGEGVPAATV
jgi:hypothetical protein